MAREFNCMCAVILRFDRIWLKHAILFSELNYNRKKFGPLTAFRSEWKIEKAICYQKLYEKNTRTKIGHANKVWISGNLWVWFPNVKNAQNFQPKVNFSPNKNLST